LQSLSKNDRIISQSDERSRHAGCKRRRAAKKDMKTYKSTYGKIYLAAILAIMVLMAASFVGVLLLLEGAARIGFAVFFAVVFAVCIWMLCGTSYTFGENVLICRCGPFSEKILYSKLRTATKCKGYVFSLALSELRIELRYGKGDTDAVFISPVDEDAFLASLKEKAPSMEILDA